MDKPHGGKREGAGRPIGSPNKATIERQREIEESGLTPLDFLLSVMRDEGADLDKRIETAKAAAPFVHPKLSSIHMDGSLNFMSHEDDDQIERYIEAKIGELRLREADRQARKAARLQARCGAMTRKGKPAAISVSRARSAANSTAA